MLSSKKSHASTRLIVLLVLLGSAISFAGLHAPERQGNCTDEKGNPIECPTEDPAEDDCFDNQGNPCDQDDEPQDKPTPKPTRTPVEEDDGDGKKPTPTPVPQVAIPQSIPPSISIFTVDVPSIEQGKCAKLAWAVDNAQSVSLTSDLSDELFLEPQGQLDVCPPKTSTFILTGYGKPGSVPEIVTTTIIITVIPSPIQQACTSFDLGPIAIVIDFEGVAAGTEILEAYRSQGVIFRAGRVATPAMGAHSGTRGATSPFGDLGSYGLPITASLSRSFSAVGMYVGRESPSAYGEGFITATLVGQVYAADGSFVGLVSDEVELPNEAQPISRCLVIRAGEGQVIRSFALEYADEGGNSLYDPRWMDDLTLVPSNVSARDLPPFVTILTPANGARVTTSSVTSLIRILEDVGIVRVEYVLNGIRSDMSFTPSSGSDPRLYGASALLTGFRPFGTNTLRVIAWDTAGQSGEAMITFSNWPIADLDIEVLNVEVVQVVQCLNNPRCRDNSVPMIIGKPTVARVYARILRGPASVAGISGAICLGTTGVDGCSGPLRPFGPITVTNAALDGLRPDLRVTLNFIIPDSWISSPGGLRLTGYANYRGENVDECCLENNLRTVAVGVQASKRLDVVFVQVRANGATSDLNERWGLAAWINRVYPIARVGVWETAGRILSSNYNFRDATGRSLFYSGCGEGWSQLLEGLWWHNFWTSDPADYTRYYGMVDAGSLTDSPFSGCGAEPGSVSGGIVRDAAGPTTAAQEIGHNHNRLHSPGCGAGGPDMGFPTPNGSLDDWGLDISRLFLHRPAVTFDYIGYCGGPTNTWTSVYTYLQMISAIQSVANVPQLSPKVAVHLQPLAESSEYFVGGGQVMPGQATFTYGFFRTFLPAGSQDELAYGPYLFEMQAADGAVLYSRNFMPAQYSNEVPSASGPYQIVAPWIEGTQRVVIYLEGVEIGRKEASANAPVVQLISPAAGDVWGNDGLVSVTWEAIDSDGDVLTYAVQYSRDGGTTWATLSANVSETTLELDAAAIPGTPQALIRVVASDGFNSAEATSLAAFSVTGKSPSVHIGSPEDGYAIEENWPVWLQALGTDPEDGPLAPDSFLWESSLDGPLAAGDSLTVQTLSVGQHVINVTGMDSDGNAATSSVTITVGESTAPELRSASQLPPFSDGFKRQAALVGLGLILVVGLVLLGLRRIFRRKSA